MANVIALAEKYLPILDEIYKRESLTDILLKDLTVRYTGANKIEVFETAMDGLADYDRNNGFVKGSVTSGWQGYELTQDRGISLSVDAMDNEETIGMAFGTLSGEFVRTKEVPELDAYRFAKMASATGIGAATPADITVGTTDVPGLIEEGEEYMGDNEVTREGKILFVSEKCYRGLKSKITRIVANENGIDHNVEVYNDMRVVRVPKNRFNTAISFGFRILRREFIHAGLVHIASGNDLEFILESRQFGAVHAPAGASKTPDPDPDRLFFLFRSSHF